MSHSETPECAKDGNFYNRIGLLGHILDSVENRKGTRKSSSGNDLLLIEENIRPGFVRFGPVFPVHEVDRAGSATVAVETPKRRDFSRFHDRVYQRMSPKSELSGVSFGPIRGTTCLNDAYYHESLTARSRRVAGTSKATVISV